MKGFLDTSKFNVCSLLEENYNIILDEYKKFKFNIVEDNSSDENWMWWKLAYEHSLDITKNFRQDLDWDEISFAPYKRSHSCYGLILNEQSIWEGVLLSTKATHNFNFLPELKTTEICNQYFSKTSDLVKQFDEVTSVMIARFPPNRKIPKHKGYKEIIRVHMGLVVPEGDIGFGVSDQTTKWQNGKCLAFVDSSTHYAWNNTEQDRINLIIDLDRRKVIGSK